MVGTSNLGGKPPFSYGFSDVFPISHWFSYGFWTTTEPTTTCRHPIRPGAVSEVQPSLHPDHAATPADGHGQRRGADLPQAPWSADDGRGGLGAYKKTSYGSYGMVGYPLVNLQKTMENHNFQWGNPLFLWSFSIAMLNYQRVIMIITVVLTMFFFPITYLFMIFQLSIDYNGSVMDCNGSATFDYQSWGG